MFEFEAISICFSETVPADIEDKKSVSNELTGKKQKENTEPRLLNEGSLEVRETCFEISADLKHNSLDEVDSLHVETEGEFRVDGH